MTYYALCTAICLAALLICYAMSAVIASTAEWIIVRAGRRWPVETRARAVFTCRVAPAIIAVSVTLGLVLPSFVRWEPAGTSESISLRLAWLSAMTLLLAAVAGWRLARAVAASYVQTQRWRLHSKRLPDFAGVPVYELPNAGALVTTTGLLAGQIFVSSNVIASLTPAELDAALSHERAHVASSDNLRQLLLRVLRLPCASGDRVWTAGAEVRADLRALYNRTPAVELASALIKVARLRNSLPVDARAAVSCLIPAGQEGALADRVRRLTDLVSGGVPQPARSRAPRFRWLCFLAAAIAVAIVAQPSILQFTHELIERLV